MLCAPPIRPNRSIAGRCEPVRTVTHFDSTPQGSLVICSKCALISNTLRSHRVRSAPHIIEHWFSNGRNVIFPSCCDFSYKSFPNRAHRQALQRHSFGRQVAVKTSAQQTPPQLVCGKATLGTIYSSSLLPRSSTGKAVAVRLCSSRIPQL